MPKDGSSKISISARADEVGDNLGEIDALVEGEETKIAFNSKYLTDVLAVLSEGDVALELRRQGHEPSVFCPLPGPVADQLRDATIPVALRVEQLGVRPDVIHGQHHVVTMSALLAFPGVPAVSVCHGWRPWEEAAPLFPRVRRYVAVDETTRDRLVSECGVPAAR